MTPSANPFQMKSFFLNRQGEFRLAFLYFPAVLFFGILANIDTPILEVCWDMVFYKSMAHGLYHFSTFDLHQHFPVPPLYPSVLAIGNIAPNYLWVEIIQSWINPAIYFLGLYPLYSLSRLFLNVRDSRFACLLYLLYPTSIYTQWTLSENLAIPLTLWAAAHASRMRVNQRPTIRDGIYLGIILSALVLTRVQAIVVVVCILLWMLYGWLRRQSSYAPFVISSSVFTVLTVTLWWWFGYLAGDGLSLFYSDVKLGESESALFFLFINRFWAHGTALWLEGALLVPTLAVMLWLRTLFSRSSNEPALKTISSFLIFLSLSIVISVSLYRILRADMEPWSISLRHACYGNLLLIPLCVAAMGGLASVNLRKWIVQTSMLLGIVAWFAGGFWLPDVWRGLCYSHDFFTNAPSLDFMKQLKGETVWAGGGFLAALSFVFGISCLWNRKIGMVVLTVLFVYIQAQTIDYTLFIRHRAAVDQHVEEIHEFCARLEAGHWEGIPIFIDEKRESLYKSANLIYWINRKANALPNGEPKPNPPFLYLTHWEQKDAELVFHPGFFRVYLFHEPMTD